MVAPEYEAGLSPTGRRHRTIRLLQRMLMMCTKRGHYQVCSRLLGHEIGVQ
jgi:hypothetical protein